jgi:hypothetical protein
MATSNKSQIETVENVCSCELTTTHAIIAVPLTRSEDGKLSLPESATGKTKQVATTHGNINTGTKIKGAAVFAGVNVYLRND